MIGSTLKKVWGKVYARKKNRTKRGEVNLEG